jgi:hypothetical protein
VSPWLSWALILAAVPVVYWLSVWVVGWLMGPGDGPCDRDPAAAGSMARHPSRLPKADDVWGLCQCRKYAFCHAEPRWFDAAGVRHAPDLCQPLREVA